MRIRLLAALITLPLLVAACSITPVTLNYQPSANTVVVAAKPLVEIGAFADRRGTDPHWLGAIRDGYGGAMKVLQLQDTASAMVAQAYGQALTARGLLVTAGNARYVLSGDIMLLDCSQYVRREAHANIMLTVTDNATGKPVMEKLFKKTIVEGSILAMDTGLFASVDDLKAVAVQALNEVINESLDSEAFRDAARDAAKGS